MGQLKLGLFVVIARMFFVDITTTKLEQQH